MNRRIPFLLALFAAFAVYGEKQFIWPEGKMPDPQPHQIAAMTDVSRAEGFNADEWRFPYLEWHETPENPNGICAILLSGGSYKNLCDVSMVKDWRKKLTKLGCRCVTLVYRTPWPKDLPYYQTAWQDGQRAVRLVRAAAKEKGFDPEKIITVSMSAGSHLATLLATSSLSPSYEKIDESDDIPCYINAAIAFAPAFVLTDGIGKPNTTGGDGPDVALDDCFKFDDKTAPMCLLHGGKDQYSPIGTTKIYRELRKKKVNAEIHLFPDGGHRPYGFDRAVEFLRQLGMMGELEKEVAIANRYKTDPEGVTYFREDVWPEGKIPNLQSSQNIPYIEWYIPSNLTTKAIQVIWSGGSYNRSKPLGYEVAPVRRYLNSKGMAVVTLCYRHPRPEGLEKHITAWQDEQRTIRIVRSKAAEYGLDPERIGAMGFSAGGHLTLMAATSSQTSSYSPIDDVDKLPCNVQWAIAIYPAYTLTEGNKDGGNFDSSKLVPEFAFDSATPPMMFLHGDTDGYVAMGSVKAWEHLRRMGIQCELHTLVKRGHCFQKTASPETASYNYLERILDYLKTIKSLP